MRAQESGICRGSMLNISAMLTKCRVNIHKGFQDVEDCWWSRNRNCAFLIWCFSYLVLFSFYGTTMNTARESGSKNSWKILATLKRTQKKNCKKPSGRTAGKKFARLQTWQHCRCKTVGFMKPKGVGLWKLLQATQPEADDLAAIPTSRDGLFAYRNSQTTKHSLQYSEQNHGSFHISPAPHKYKI